MASRYSRSCAPAWDAVQKTSKFAKLRLLIHEGVDGTKPWPQRRCLGVFCKHLPWRRDGTGRDPHGDGLQSPMTMRQTGTGIRTTHSSPYGQDGGRHGTAQDGNCSSHSVLLSGAYFPFHLSLFFMPREYGSSSFREERWKNSVSEQRIPQMMLLLESRPFLDATRKSFAHTACGTSAHVRHITPPGRSGKGHSGVFTACYALIELEKGSDIWYYDNEQITLRRSAQVSVCWCQRAIRVNTHLS